MKVFAELLLRRVCIEEMVAETNLLTAWQRLHDEQGMKASYSSFRRYVQRHLPGVLKRAHITVRREEPPPGDEAQIDSATWDCGMTRCRDRNAACGPSPGCYPTAVTCSPVPSATWPEGLAGKPCAIPASIQPVNLSPCHFAAATLWASRVMVTSHALGPISRPVLGRCAWFTLILAVHAALRT